MKSRSGFTIVELLIVIVVIAILAAVAVVAYNGIQNRVNDTAVQNDLRNLAQLLQTYEIEKDEPIVMDNTADIKNSAGDNISAELAFAPNKRAYSATYVLYVCRQTSAPSNFVVGSQSVTGNKFAYRVGQGFIDYPAGEHTDVWGNGGTSCPRLLGIPASPVDYTYTFGKGSGGWAGWIK